MFAPNSVILSISISRASEGNEGIFRVRKPSRWITHLSTVMNMMTHLPLLVRATLSQARALAAKQRIQMRVTNLS